MLEFGTDILKQLCVNDLLFENLIKILRAQCNFLANQAANLSCLRSSCSIKLPICIILVLFVILFFLVYKKGVGAVLLPILDSQAFALPTSHRIDNAVSPRQNGLYINKVYRNAPRRRLGCHLPVVMLRSCEVRESQRQTFENVFLITKTARRPLLGSLNLWSLA